MTTANCARLKNHALPSGVPEGAIRDKKSGFWRHRGADGTYHEYASDGSLSISGHYNGLIRTGIWKFYARDGRTLIQRGEYKNHYRHGIWKSYDASGRLYQRTQYRPEPKHNMLAFLQDYGNENGPYHRYYANGNLEEIGHFRAGMYHGSLIRYYQDGTLALRGMYQRGKKNGLWRSYYPSGNLEREETYRSGILHGRSRRFRKNGSLVFERFL